MLVDEMFVGLLSSTPGGTTDERDERNEETARHERPPGISKSVPLEQRSHEDDGAEPLDAHAGREGVALLAAAGVDHPEVALGRGPVRQRAHRLGLRGGGPDGRVCRFAVGTVPFPRLGETTVQGYGGFSRRMPQHLTSDQSDAAGSRGVAG